MDDVVVSLNGVMYRVRSCTEQHGLWVEAYRPNDKGEGTESLLRDFAAVGATPENVDELRAVLDASAPDDDEPYMDFFIPGDVAHAIADMLRSTRMEVEPDEDEDGFVLLELGDDERPGVCEHCKEPATTQDDEGVPLCDECMDKLIRGEL